MMRKKNEKKKSSVFNNLRNTWNLVKEHNKKLYVGLIFVLLVSIISAISPMLSAKIFLSISNGLLNDLLKVALIVLMINVLRIFCNYLMNIAFQKYSLYTSLAVQIKVAKETLNLQIKEIDHNSTGLFIDRITKDTNEMSSIFIDLGSSALDIISSIGILVAIFVINPYICIFFIVTSAILFYLEKLRATIWTKMDKIRRKRWEINTSLTGELIRGIRDVKDLNCGDNFLNIMNSSLTEANEQGYRVNKTNTMYRAITDNLQHIFDFIFILLGIFLIRNDLIAISSFVICYMYKDQVRGLLRYFSWTIELLKKYDVAATRVFEIINNDTFKKEEFGNKHLDKATGNFEFKDVYFGYNDNKDVLKGISFKIKANETIAFVGKSGEGKTTIFNLLNKLYTTNRGEILIDGININELDCDSIRNNMSIISQSPYIFNMSIKDNLKMVKPNLTKKEMIEACKIACFDEYVETLPDKYDTVVGEGGVTLSGGLKQRLAIARALIQKTQIILFDEATSSLDNETQSKIQQSIRNMKGDYTIIMIAHRLSTVKDADRILVISEGKVIDEGNHQYLLKHNKEYKRLYQKEMI